MLNFGGAVLVSVTLIFGGCRALPRATWWSFRGRVNLWYHQVVYPQRLSNKMAYSRFWSSDYPWATWDSASMKVPFWLILLELIWIPTKSRVYWSSIPLWNNFRVDSLQHIKWALRIIEPSKKEKFGSFFRVGFGIGLTQTTSDNWDPKADS